MYIVPPVFFKKSGSAEGGLRIEKNKTGVQFHEARQFDNKNDRDVWEQVVFLHKRLLVRFHGNKASDESSVTKILDSLRVQSRRWGLGAPNKRITTTLVGPSSNGWSECEAALFVLCVKDAATMDNKLDFWLINARSGSLKKMKTKDGKTITVW